MRLEHDGKMMTCEQYAALSDADKRALTNQIQRYMDSGQRG
jgi:hypothetical protein